VARTVRIFLASPGDVADERALALKVLERLPYDAFLRGKLSIEVVAWDKPGAGTPMLATMTPQEAIANGLPKPSECDIVVAVFWSRMGTLLPQDWVKPPALRYHSGTEFETLDARFLSGTEWEYFDALQAADSTGKPRVLVYRRTEKQLLDQDDPGFDGKREQYKLVKAFFDAFRNPDGSLRHGYNEYATPTAFERDLEHHLRDVLKGLLEAPAPPDARANPVKSPGAEAPLWNGSPFPGLGSFLESDWPIYFGRGRETDGLIRKLADPSNRFIAIVGASGSGKSSLVRAGLIPRLLGQAPPRRKDQPRVGALPGSQDWAWLRFTPGEVGDDPFVAFAIALRATLDNGLVPREVAAELHHDLRVLDQWVALVLEKKPEWAKLLLFVDQFEELFTLVAPHYHDALVQLLARATELDRVRTVVALRADFYHRCLEWPALRTQFESLQLEKSHYPLTAPGLGQLYEMITRPAERAGLTFEEGLPERILNDTGIEPGALPLMAFALSELYQTRTVDGCLNHAAYDAFGGVGGAIGRRADSAFQRLPPGVQAELGHVFRDLVEIDERGVATRRRALLQRVAASNEARALVNALTDARLLVASDGEVGGSVVEVAHEALFRSWPSLTRWIQDTTDDHRLRRQISQLASYWKDHGHKDKHRWPDDRVPEAVAMLDHLGLESEDLSEVEQDFLGPLDRDRMLGEIEHATTPHTWRAVIGVRVSLLGDPRPGVGLGKDGLPDLVWCQVPAGEVTLEGNGESFTVAEPFYIATYLITYAQFRAFLEADDGHADPRWWEGILFQIDRSGSGRQFNRRDNHPAENVTWLEAIAFCRWLSEKLGYTIRLPTEWEWQQAATGGQPDREYPWPGGWDLDHANTYGSDLSRSTAVGMYPQGASPVGALDMAGNVWEWCLNEYSTPSNTDLSGDARRVMRGGSWNYEQGEARTAFRSSDVPNYCNLDVGFRVMCLAPPCP
jgi:Sulfatase-modifying factor enzyme 1